MFMAIDFYISHIPTCDDVNDALLFGVIGGVLHADLVSPDEPSPPFNKACCS
jgi:hypothetical protein